MSDLYIFGYGSSGPSTIDISSATVTLGTALIYNGTEQAQTVTVAVNGTTLTENTDYTITDNTATNAGSYTLSILGTGAYSGTKTVSWSIAKAQGSISVNPSSLTIIGANSTGTATITSVGDGTISATSSDTSVATVGVSGNTVTVTSVGSGSATITVTLGAGTNYTGDSATISVSVVTISSTLSDNTPEQIKAAAQAGIASTLWSVGARTAAISFSAVWPISAISACVFIIGFDHNSSIEGTNRIHFQFGKTTSGKDVAFVDNQYSTSCISGTWFNMNNGDSNSGGWSSSRMRGTICPAFLSALPSGWQSVISDCTKYTNNIGNSTDSSVVTSTTDKIFLLAEYEVFGSISQANSYEQNSQQQYAYYKNGASRIKYRHSSTGSTCYWWLRSPCAYFSNRFCCVYTDGSATNPTASYSYGFAPAFCVA